RRRFWKGSRAVEMYRRWGADRIVGEKNFGGDVVLAIVQPAERAVAYKAGDATRGKVVHVEPIAAIYE
ncbi:MAG TPA: DNA-packaging protein, partial [Sphingobium sp.]|nr:DNA-packaging protein [Sphingobium sp.]